MAKDNVQVAEDKTFIDNFVSGSQSAQSDDIVITDDGAQGVQGVQEVQGADDEGAQGVQGDTVVTSDEGAQGAQGNQGAQSTPIDYEKLYNEERQRTASWDGRVKAEAQRANDLEKKLQEITDKAKQDTTLSLEELIQNDPEVTAFTKEMGDDFTKPFLKLLNAAARKIIDDVVKPLNERVTPLENKIVTQDEEATKEHYRTIQAAHPDIVALLKKDAINKWIETLPYKQAIEKQHILKEGGTNEVIDLLNEYKKTLPKPKGQPPAKEVIDAATAVKTGPGVLPGGVVKPTDFEGTFNEITKEKK